MKRIRAEENLSRVHVTSRIYYAGVTSSTVDLPPESLEQAAAIAAVETALPEHCADECPALMAANGRLVDDTAVRLFALCSPEEQPLRDTFDRICDEWEAAGTQSGVTEVCARGDEPIPWIAVEQRTGESFRDVVPTLSSIEKRTVLAQIAETLWRTESPHLTCAPEYISVSLEDGLAVQIDWAIGRLCLQGSDCDGDGGKNPYIAPEVRRDLDAGDERSDVYTLGALSEYALTGTDPDPERGRTDSPWIGRQATESENPLHWLSTQAMETDPDRRFESCYAVKRAALFGHSERTDPETGRQPAVEYVERETEEWGYTEEREPDSTYTADAGVEGSPEQDRYHGQYDPIASQTAAGTPDETRRDQHRSQGGQHQTRRDQDQTQRNQDQTEGADSDQGKNIPYNWLGEADISRRQALGATAAGIGLVGAATGLGYWYQRDSGTEGTTATTDGTRYEITAAFDAGIIELTNTGTGVFETDRVLLYGDGFLYRGETLVEYVDSEEFSPDETIRIPADSAYELAVYHLRGNDSTKIAESEGPDATEREPKPGPLYIPDFEFSIEEVNGEVIAEYRGGPPIPADHVRAAGFRFSNGPVVRWDELMEVQMATDDNQEINPVDFTRYQVTPETILRVEWAPPYMDASTTVAQYQGSERPLNADLGGVTAPRYDAKNTGAALPDGEVREQPAEVLSIDLDETPHGSLAVDNGRLFVSAGQYLYAFDGTDGELLWHRHIGTEEVFPPAVENELVFVGTRGSTGEATLYAFNVLDGSTEWEFSTEGAGLWSPTVSEGLVFTGGTEASDDIYVLDTRSGTDETILEDATLVGFPAFDSQHLYVRDVSGEIKALVPTGTEWSYPANGASSPTVEYGMVYGWGEHGRVSGRLFALDSLDGSEQWTVETEGRVLGEQAVTDNTVFAGTDQGMVYAVNAETGEKQWTVEMGKQIEHGAVVSGETLYIAGLDGISGLALDDGRTRWSLGFETTLTTEPAVSDGKMYVGLADGRIVALEG